MCVRSVNYSWVIMQSQCRTRLKTNGSVHLPYVFASFKNHIWKVKKLLTSTYCCNIVLSLAAAPSDLKCFHLWTSVRLYLVNEHRQPVSEQQTHLVFPFLWAGLCYTPWIHFPFHKQNILVGKNRHFKGNSGISCCSAVRPSGGQCWRQTTNSKLTLN